jgi:anti-sigma factor RsiW
MNHIADNQDALLDYLYEEGDPAERLAIAKHLQECAPCSVAVLEFQSVRGMFKEWTPPASQLGFRVVHDAPSVPRVPFKAAPWLQAAAAILIFAAGMAVSQLDVDYQKGRLIVSMQGAAPVPDIRTVSTEQPAPRVNASPAPASPQVDLAALERELRARLESQNASSIDVEQLLQRVRAMIDQSEQRQQRELALRLSQVAREVDTQHRADLLRVQQEFGQQQEATMDYLVRTSGGTK